ncbi:MAG: Ser/Thr protein kinase RdoA (MazF antagonist) [Phycisphaerales bacterium]|jgi:Ser/Thr protein kinase RdoA (MazF antagonist)
MTLPKDKPRLSADEVRTVLSHYALGEVRSVRELIAGASLAPKALIESDRGQFVLKRRAPGRDDPLLVALSHEVQLHLTIADVPVTRLIGTRDENNSMLQTGYHVYEMTALVQGLPFASKPRRAEAAGATLARAHAAWAGFTPTSAIPPTREPTRPMIEASLVGAQSPTAKPLLQTAQAADDSLAAILQGTPPPEPVLIHGDIHPGNFLFSESLVAAFFDFDGVQLGPRAHDIAQGLAQFSLTRTGPAPDHWQPHADLTLAAPFLAAYLAEASWPTPPLEAWPYLMAESLVFEAARTTLPEPILRAVAKKAAWLVENQGAVCETFARAVS